MSKDDRTCKPLQLTRHEARLLVIAAGSRLDHLMHARAADAITGPEVQKRMEEWKVIMAKLDMVLLEDT